MVTVNGITVTELASLDNVDQGQEQINALNTGCIDYSDNEIGKNKEIIKL